MSGGPLPGELVEGCGRKAISLTVITTYGSTLLLPAQSEYLVEVTGVVVRLGFFYMGVCGGEVRGF